MRAYRRAITFSLGMTILGAAALAPTACTQSKPSHVVTPAEVHLEDRSAKLTTAQRTQLIAKLERAGATTHGVFAAIIVPTMQGETVEQLAEKTFKSWQLGDNGVLVVIAIQERKSRIETGHAVERSISDDQASAVLLDHLNPHLRQGDFFGGLDETFEALQALLPPQK